MTLKEFTAKYAPLPKALPQNVVWRKVFPSNLRQHRIIDKEMYYRFPTFLAGYVDEISHLELEEQWERIHAGEVIDTEWRKVYVY